jgi:hypothetical protein
MLLGRKFEGGQTKRVMLLARKFEGRGHVVREKV